MKYLQPVLLMGLLYLLFTKGVAPGWREVHSDFANYYVAADLVVDGANLDNIYDNAWFQAEIKARGIDTPGKFSPFPPMSAWIMTPLAWLSPLAAQRAFVALNVMFLLLGIVAVRAITNWTLTSAALLVLGSGLSLFNNLALGQVYWIMTVCLLIAILLYRKDQHVAAGVVLGFFSALKYIPAVLIAGYFFHGLLSHGEERKRSLTTAVAALLAIVALSVIQLAFFGEKVMGDYLFSALAPHLQGDLPGQNMYSHHFQSWDSLLRYLFVYHPQFNPSPFVDWSGGRRILKLMIAAAILLSTASVMRRYRGAAPGQRSTVYLSILSAAFMVILPASATYHFIFLLIPTVLLIESDLPSRRWQYYLIAIYCAIGFIPYGLAYRMAGVAGVLFAFPRLWLASAFYIVMSTGLHRSRSRSLS